MYGKIELTFLAWVLAALLGLGLMNGPAPDSDPVQHGPHTANAIAWNN